MRQTALIAIPQPPPTFLLKNLRALHAMSPIQDMVALARAYGPIYRLDMRHRVLLVVSGYDLVNELCDDQRFDKSIRGALGLVRRFAGDGLFTARTQEPNWAKAHNILLPNFGQRAMQGYHPMMLDIAEQLVRKWERLGADEEIDVTSEMTRLTVDTIGLCGFHYRFNSFYHDTEHPELALPPGLSYRTGGHLGVLPQNSPRLVARVAARFGLEPETVLRIRPTGQRKSWLPVDYPVTLAHLLTVYVELQEVATRAQLQTLLAYTACPPEQAKLAALAGDDAAGEARYKSAVLGRRASLLDVLEECPACTLPFAVYLELLTPLRPRYYSISSSPLAEAQRCSLTVAVVAGPARSGQGLFEGVCSTYLGREEAGNVIDAFIKDPPAAFRLPADPATPLLMIGPGTGLAPFRGFLQERAALQAQGTRLGQALLFFGCRHPQQDYIYEDELRNFVEQGVTGLVVAFSRLTGQEKRYVQDEMYAHCEAVWQLLEDGAVVYVCGDASRMAPDVRGTLATIYREKTGGDEAAAESWLQTLTAQQRYCVDVWAAS